MNYLTVEVDLDHGQVRPRGPGQLPERARALLTVLESDAGASVRNPDTAEAGLVRFLSGPDFALTPEQFRASMEVDFFEQ